MDTKAQNIPITHTQPHSNSRSQSHMCSHCNCSHHCQNCSWGQGWSQSPTGHCSLTAHRSQGPRSSPLPKRRRHAMHSHHGRKQPTTRSCRYPKNKKILEGKVKKRKVVKRSPRRAYKTKRRSSGRKRN